MKKITFWDHVNDGIFSECLCLLRYTLRLLFVLILYSVIEWFDCVMLHWLKINLRLGTVLNRRSGPHQMLLIRWSDWCRTAMQSCISSGILPIGLQCTYLVMSMGEGRGQWMEMALIIKYFTDIQVYWKLFTKTMEEKVVGEERFKDDIIIYEEIT